MEAKKDESLLLHWRRHVVQSASRRKNHPAACVGGRVYIVGGFWGQNLADVLFVENTDRGYRQTTLAPSNTNLYTPKNGHSANLVGDKLYVIGGWTGGRVDRSVCVFDLVLNSWSRPTVYGNAHAIPNMHTAEYIEKLDQIVCFGGSDGRTFLNNVTCLEVSTLRWEPLEPKGARPGERSNHKSCVYGSTYYVFGGWNPGKRFSDLAILQFSGRGRATWSSVVANSGPPATSGACIVEFHGKIILYGGSAGGGLSTMFAFDLETKSWTSVNKADKISRKHSGSVQFTGVIPPRRFGHTMTNVGGKTLLVYGGYGDSTQIQNAVYTLERIP